MKHIIKGFTGGLLGLLLLAGCSNVLLQPSRTSDEPPVEAGTGRLTITLTGTGIDQGARTLYPSAPVSFSKYELVFTPTSGQAGISPVMLTDGASSYTMSLPIGSWTIMALGYVQIQDIPGVTDGDYAAARGETAVTVGPYTSVSKTIDLCGGLDAGPGVFSYDITLPTGLDSATLAILSLEGNPVESVDLQTAASGVFALDNGYYLLTINRVKGGVSEAWTEVVHIYAGWTTEAAGAVYNFTGVITVNSIAELSDALSAQPLNTASTPYTLVLSGLDLETDLGKSEDPLRLLYEALDGKYVSLDLSACAGNIPNAPNIYTADSRPNKDKIVSVTLSDTLTSIGLSAFDGCSSLPSIDLPDTLTSIGGYAFRGCTSLASIDLQNTTITSIGEAVFRGCSSLVFIDLPNTLTSIGTIAFSGCTFLAAIDLPDTLTSIGMSAFSGCTSLASIDLPDTLTSITWSVFDGCSSLASIDLPNTLTSIGRYAFSGCTALTAIDLPDTLSSIERYAFSGCTALTAIDLSNTILTSIENNAFEDCSSLASIDLPNTLTSIREGVFWYCSSLATVISRNTTPPELGVNNALMDPFYWASSSLLIYVPDARVNVYQNAWSSRASKITPLSELPGA